MASFKDGPPHGVCTHPILHRSAKHLTKLLQHLANLILGTTRMNKQVGKHSGLGQIHTLLPELEEKPPYLRFFHLSF